MAQEVGQLVLDGAGVAWLPSWFVEDDLRRRRLTRVLPDLQLPTIDVFAYYLRQSRSANALRVVVAALEQGLAPERKETQAALQALSKSQIPTPDRTAGRFRS